MWGCKLDWKLYIHEIMYLHATLHVAKLTHSITTDHKHAIYCNTVLPI